MVNSNAVVNALGPTFVSQLVAERGAEPADVVRAFRIAREVTGADARWEVVERLEGVDRAAQLELMGGVDALVEETTRWYLTWEPEGDIEETIAAGRDGFERLAAVLGELGSEERRRRREQTAERLVGLGVPEPLARAHALRPELRYAPGHGVGGGRDRPPDRGGRRRSSSPSAPSCAWTGSRASSSASRLRPARSAGRCRRCARTPRRSAASSPAACSPRARRFRGEAVEAFLAERGDALRRLTAFLRSLSREGEPDLAGLTLAVRQLRTIVD